MISPHSESLECEEPVTMPKRKKGNEENVQLTNTLALCRTLRQAIEKAEIIDYETKCSDVIRDGLTHLIKTMLESLISVSRNRQAWQCVRGNDALQNGKVIMRNSKK